MTWFFRQRALARLLKENPYHDAEGRFTSAENATSAAPRHIWRELTPEQMEGGYGGGMIDFKINQQYGARRKEITDEERTALSRYKGFAYADINNSLRGKPLARETDKKNVSQLIAQLDSAIDKIALDEPMMTWRGASSEDFANLKVGDVISDKGFVSTSMNPVRAVAFAGNAREQDPKVPVVLMKIELPAGTHAWPYANDKYENELLLGRGARFEVTSVTSAKADPDVSLWIKNHPQLRSKPPSIITLRYTGSSVEKAENVKERLLTSVDERFTWRDGDVAIKKKAGS